MAFLLITERGALKIKHYAIIIAQGVYWKTDTRGWLAPLFLFCPDSYYALLAI